MLPRVSIPSTHSLSSRPYPADSALYRVQPPHLYNQSPIQSSPLPPLTSRPHMVYSQGNSAHQPHTGFSSLLEPSMDPSSADFRAFYPYIPNEVKHRRRTTTAQLKVLEGVFKHDTKPNASLRKELALQLDMSARGVQVWFQNRRAKEKTKASKISTSKPILDGPSIRSTSPQSPEENEPVPESPSESQDSATPNLEFGEQSLQNSSPIAGPLHHARTESPESPWQNSPLESPAGIRLIGESDVHLLGLRRGSLPVDAFPPSSEQSYGPPSVDDLDPLARRRSVDLSIRRLATNPYAPLARAKNGALFGTRMSPQGNRHGNPYMSHRMHPRASLPHLYPIRRSSMDSRSVNQPYPNVSPPSLSPFSAVRASLPDSHLYAMSSRVIASPPLPGPLPSPNFSFGDPTGIPSPHSADSERSSPDAYQANYQGDDFDEDDTTSSSYDAFSRFGSIASVATSESSNSGYYSEVGSCIADHEFVDQGSRRGSCASNNVLDLMSSLHMNGHNSQEHVLYLEAQPLAATLRDDLLQHRNSLCDSGAYPSPSSTISAGDSPSHSQEEPAANIPISTSSELNYALQDKPEQVPNSSSQASTLADPAVTFDQILDQSHDSALHYGQNPTSLPTDNANESTTHFYYPDELAYPSSDSTSSGSSLQLSSDYTEKYPFDRDVAQVSSGHYHTSFAPPADNQYVDSFLNGNLQEHLGMPNEMDYRHGVSSSAPGPYSMYGIDSVDPSALSAPLEHDQRRTDSYATYP